MDLPFNKDNFTALQLAKETSDSRLEEALANLETANAALVEKDTKAEELNALIEANTTAIIDAADTAKVELTALVETRVGEAMANGVEKTDVIMQMVNAESDAEASKIAIDYKSSTGTPQSEGETYVDLWDGIVKKGK